MSAKSLVSRSLTRTFTGTSQDASSTTNAHTRGWDVTGQATTQLTDLPVTSWRSLAALSRDVIGPGWSVCGQSWRDFLARSGLYIQWAVSQGFQFWANISPDWNQISDQYQARQKYWKLIIKSLRLVPIAARWTNVWPNLTPLRFEWLVTDLCVSLFLLRVGFIN